MPIERGCTLRELAGVCFSPTFAVALLVALVGVGVASAAGEGASDVGHRGAPLNWPAIFSAIASSLLTTGLTLPFLVLRFGRWFERRLVAIEEAAAAAARAHQRADSAHKLAGQALDEARDHVADHARGAFR